MGINWTIKKNYPSDKGYMFEAKSEKDKAKERITFLATKQQKAAIKAYCDNEGLEVSEFIRRLIGEYFSKTKFNIPGDQPEDSNQLKLYPD